MPEVYRDNTISNKDKEVELSDARTLNNPRDSPVPDKAVWNINNMYNNHTYLY